MRGDSLRDLYAKTVALMGLGVLAGAGALVDFWPVGVKLVSVSSALQVPEVARETPVVLSTPPDAASRPIERTVARVIRRPVEPLPMAAPVIEPQVTVVAAAAAVLQTTITDAPIMILADNVVTEFSLPAIDVARPAVTAFALDAVETIAPGAEPWVAPESALDGTQINETRGLLSGALKKTQSLVRTSARTGASIVDAVRVGLGVVRRALPDYRDQSFRPGT